MSFDALSEQKHGDRGRQGETGGGGETAAPAASRRPKRENHLAAGRPRKRNWLRRDEVAKQVFSRANGGALNEGLTKIADLCNGTAVARQAGETTEPRQAFPAWVVRHQASVSGVVSPGTERGPGPHASDDRGCSAVPSC